MFPGLRAAAAVTVVKCLNTGYLRSSYNDRLNAWSCNLDFRPDGKFNWIVSPSEDCEELLGFYPTPAPAIRACQPGAGAAISAVFTSSVLHIILCVLWLTPPRSRVRHESMTLLMSTVSTDITYLDITSYTSVDGSSGSKTFHKSIFKSI